MQSTSLKLLLVFSIILFILNLVLVGYLMSNPQKYGAKEEDFNINSPSTPSLRRINI